MTKEVLRFQHVSCGADTLVCEGAPVYAREPISRFADKSVRATRAR